MGKHKKSSKKSKHKKEKKHKHKRASSSESSSEHEWVEKSPVNSSPPMKTADEPPVKSEQPKLQREDWLDLSGILCTASTSDRRKMRELEKTKKRFQQQYDPGTCPRELNPYWKNGGTGLPEFKKPSESLDLNEINQHREKKNYNWKTSRKNEENLSEVKDDRSYNYEKNYAPEYEDKSTKRASTKSEVTSLDPNIIAAKLVKAEIMGNTKLIAELKEKLAEAKQAKISETEAINDVILTQTDSKGYSRPLRIDEDPYGPKNKRKRVETYTGKQRTSYYPDDDKYSLNEMFQAEKFDSAESVDREFMKIASTIKKDDSLDDLFVDKIREKGTSSKDVDHAISDHKKMSKSLDNCSKCFGSDNMMKHLMIDYNDNCYLCLPEFEPLVDGHCILSPVRHTSCSVQLDENEWSAINSMRLKLIRLFEKHDKSVIFFEIAKNFNKYPHMVLECVPVPKKDGDLAPIYFKKAIDESETEWALNKKLVSLKGKDVRRAVPKGLPYFFVNFGMHDGFAHVIEDQRLFPSNFAQEIIGGMMDLDHSKWKRPKKENFEEQRVRVKEFNKFWKKYDN